MKLAITVIKITFLFVFLFVPAELSAQTESETKRVRSEVTPNYRINKGDKLSVKFLYHPELNEISIAVRPDGFISLQMIDDVQVVGLTTTELKNKLEKTYEEILIKPIISIILTEFVVPHVFIGGEIEKSGRYDLREGQTLLQTVFLAGGFTREANKKMVIHARPNGKGDWQIQPVNITKILSQKNPEKDLVLEDGDFIFVPESKISQLTKAIEGFRGLLPRFF